MGQAGVLGDLGESDRHKVIFEHVGAIFSNVLHFAFYTTNNGSCMPSRRLRRLDTPLVTHIL